MIVKRILLLSVSLFLLVSINGLSQDTATIVGAVTDSTGAVIPGAKVTVSNPDKAYTRNLEANSAGEFTAAKIPIGDYVITAEASGFEKLIRSGITLTVGQALRVDLQLKVGLVTQEVTVKGNVALVETETAAISDVVTGRQISNMMLNGRNFVLLAMIVPGAVPQNGLITTSVGVYANNSISFNGVRTQYNNWEIDGGNNTDEGSSGSFNTYPNLDTIAEFRISTSNYGADIGRHAGANIEMATKSGTKSFHGDLFEYVRNDHFDANDWFINRRLWSQLNVATDCHGSATGPCDAPKRPLKWNDYGYTFGGPFYIPGHYNTDKSKTFFFWSENWRKYREGTVISHDVPTLRMRQGDFSECDRNSPNFNAVISGCAVPTNPATGTPFPGDILSIDPNSRILLDAFVPKPNNGPTGHISAFSTPTNWRQEQIRVDQNISDKTSVFVRFTSDAWNTVVVPQLWSSANLDTVQTNFLGPGKSAVVHITHSFKPNLMNEFIMGYTVDHILLTVQPTQSSVSQSITKPSSWTVGNFFPANRGNLMLPDITISGNTGFTGISNLAEGGGSNRPYINSNPITTLKDNIAWTAGRHTLKFGVFLENFRKAQTSGGTPTQGSLTFSGNTGNSFSTGNGLADMFLARIQTYAEGTGAVNGVAVGGYPKGHWRQNDFESYVQDDWRVKPRLTLNLGIRYYYYTVQHDVSNPGLDFAFIPNLYNAAAEQQLDKNGKLTGPGLNFTNLGNGLVQCGTGGQPEGCQTAARGTFGPRLGFAYDPTGEGKTSIRGGYGIYYELGNGNESQQGAGGNPPSLFAPSASSINGFSTISPGPLSPPSGVVTFPSLRKWPSVQQFSLSVQHEFSGNNLLSLAYVGSFGRDLYRSRNINQIPIGIGNLNVPSLAGNTTGCDSSGNCDVQRVLINRNTNGNNTFFVPFPGYGTIFMHENTVVSSYHSLQTNFRHTFRRGLTLHTAYTWSHTIDDWWNNTGVDDSHLTRWRSTSDLNRTHVLSVNYIYDMPFFRNASNSVLKGVLGGWQFSGISTFFSGPPVNFGCGINGMNTGIGGGIRCNSLGPVNISKGVINDPVFGPTPSWWDPSKVAQPQVSQLRADNQPGMFGYMDRNALTGPGRNNWDLALHKSVQLPWFGGEHSSFEIRWETFNAFNHTQWKTVSASCDGRTAPGATCNDTLTGTPRINGGNGQVATAWPSRIMQFGLKLIF